MKTLFIVSIIIGIGITAISGIFYYQGIYTKNCEAEGGFMTGFLSCTKIIEDFATEEAMLADRYKDMLQKFRVPRGFSTGHNLDHIGSAGEKTNLAEYFNHNSSIMLFYEYCNCTDSKELLADKKTIRPDSQILDMGGIPVIAYSRAPNYITDIHDEYVFEFYYDGYRISLHTDQKLESGLVLVKELIAFMNT